MLTVQAASENLLSENAKLQVQITTLQSQNNSLATQHTALQLANSQLVAEKEEVNIDIFHLRIKHLCIYLTLRREMLKMSKLRIIFFLISLLVVQRA